MVSSSADGDAAVLEVRRVLAVKLRAARQQSALRLDDLAARSGVSRGMIHQIETGHRNPSIGTVTRLCLALGIPLSELVELTPEVAQLATRRDAIAYRHDDSEAALLLNDGRHELWQHVLVAGGSIREVGHPAESRGVIHVTDGCLELHIGADVFTVPANDGIAFRGDRPHTYRNPTRAVARYTLVITHGRRSVDRYPIHPGT